MAYPTTLALITALWAGPGRTKAIALWSGIGGAIASLGPVLSGALLEHFWWGSVFLVTLPLAVVALVLAVAVRAESRQRGDRAGRQPRRDPVRHPRRCTRPGDQLRRRPEQGDADPGPGLHRAGRAGRVPDPAAPRQEPALRPSRRGPPHLLGRRVRRRDRVRDADGRDVRGPAVPAERARLLDVRGRAVDPPGRGAAWC